VIANGITAASTGDTVNVEAGTYTENLTIAKRITLDGAGSGAGGTALVSAAGAAAPVISVTGSGLDIDNQLTIKDVSMVGTSDTSGSDAIAVYGDTPVSFIKVENVNSSEHGVGVHYRTGTISNVTVSNSTLSGNGFGVRVASLVTSMDGMTIDGCTMNDNNSSAISTNPSGTLTNINTNFTISNTNFANNSTANVTNQHDLSFFGFRGNATLSNVTLTSGNGTTRNSNSYGIVFTNGSGSAALGTVSLSNVTVQGHVGKGALTFQYYNDVSGVSMNNVSLKGCVAPWGDLIVHSTDADAMNAGNTALKSISVWSTGGVNAANVSFFSSTTATSAYDRSVLADNFAIANQISDAIDTGAGLVRWNGANIYVTLLSFDARFNNVTTALQRAIAAAQAGDTIHVENGVPVVLAASVEKSVTFSGNFTLTASSFPASGENLAAILTSFTSRLAAGSTVAVNATDMTAAQVAAVAAAMPGNLTNVAINSGYTAAQITSLLGQVNGASATVDMASMTPDQIAAVNGNVAKLSSVTNYKVRILAGSNVAQYDLFLDTRNGFGEFPGAAARANALKAANAETNYTVEMTAGTFNLDNKIVASGIILAGASMAGSIIDMSLAPMSDAGGSREQGILVTGSNTTLRNFTLQSPNRAVNNSTGAAHGIKTNPTGDNTADVNGLVVENVTVRQVKRSALDLNGARNVTLTNFVADTVSAGYGLAISGVTDGVTVNSITTTNTVWGDVGVFPYPTSSSSARPDNIVFADAGTHNINAITVQPYTSTIDISVSGASNEYHNGNAQVIVPPSFNRVVRTTRNSDNLLFNMVTRQAMVPTLTTAFATGFRDTTTLNILGSVEHVRGGVALSGKAVLDNDGVALLAAEDVVQMNVATATTTGGTIAITNAFPASASIVGTFSLTSTSFDTAAVLDSILSASGSATRSVVMTNMNESQVAAVAANVKATAVVAKDLVLANIVDALYAVNASSAAGFDNAFVVSGITPDAAYTALVADAKSAVRTDMFSNRSAGGYASVAAADAFFTKLVEFRGARDAVITGTDLVAADFDVGGRYTRVVSAVGALPQGTVLSGEVAAVYNSSTVATQFAALTVGGPGRDYVLSQMNADANDDSISAMNAAFAAGLVTAQNRDALAAGLTSADDAARITYLLGFAADNTVNVNASGMQPDQLTSVSNGIGKILAITNVSLTNAQSVTEIDNLLSKTTGAVALATDMNSAKLSKLGERQSSIAADGITGTLAIDVAVENLDALLGKTAVAATVNVNATSFTDAGKGVLSNKIGKVDAITSLALASTEDATEIANLLSKATAATAVATGMEYAQLNALGTAYAKLADDGVTGTFTITKDVTVIGNLLGKTAVAANVTVNAYQMSEAQLGEVGANIAKVDTLTNVSATNALSVTELTAVMSSSTNIFADATGMASDKLNVVAQYASNLAANGVSGTVIVTNGSTDSTLGALLAKVSSAATVEVNATGLTDTALTAVAANASKVDTLYNLTLTNAQSDAEITSLLGLSVASASEGRAMAVATATGMNDAKLSALGGLSTKLAANGITGDVALVSTISDANITNLFTRIATSANVRVNGSGMGSTTLAILITNDAKVDSAFNITVTNSQSVSDLTTLLGKSDAASASAIATGMDSNAGGKLATLADNSAKFINAGISGSISINSNLTSTQITNLLSKVSYVVSFTGGTTVAIDAQGMSPAQLTAIASSVSAAGNAATQASIFDVSNLTLTGGQTSTEIATLLNATLANEATIVATGMSQAQLAEVGNYGSAVDAIGGTITVTSDLSAAQIQSIMGNAATSANVNIDPNGFNAAQFAAVYSAPLLLATTESTPGEEATNETIVKQGDTFVVVVKASGLTTAAVGVQARLNYDATQLEFVEVLPTAAFETVIYGTAGSSGGQSYVTFATGIDVFDDSSTGITSGDVARIRFRATAAFCNDTDLVALATSGFQNKFVASSTNPAPIPAVGTNLIDVSSLNNLAFASTWSAGQSLPADAGTTAGAFVANPVVTASNNCYSSVPVTFTITYPDSTTASTWPARFPVGVSTVVWRSEDLGGNIITLSRTVEVFNYQLMTMSPRFFIAANGYAAGNRTITVRLSEDGIASSEQAQVFAFNADGQATAVDVQVPVKASYSCVSVKDDARTLARAAFGISVVGTKYDVTFAAGGDGAMKFGDSNQDNLVDILDFGIYIANRFPANGTGSDYNNNGTVTNQDFALFATNFLQTGDTCAGGFLAGQMPRDRVSVRELRRRGFGDLIAADINGDGWVDVQDIQLAMQN
jgi:predicted regulator of amino acid metabolism with ACT domain